MDVTKPYKFIGFGAMDVTRPHKCIGFGAMDVTRPYRFIGFGAMDVTKPYKFIGFGAMDVTKPYKFIWFGAMNVTKTYKFIGFGAIEGSLCPGEMHRRPASGKGRTASRPPEPPSKRFVLLLMRQAHKGTRTYIRKLKSKVCFLSVLGRFPTKVGPGTVTNGSGLKTLHESTKINLEDLPRGTRQKSRIRQ